MTGRRFLADEIVNTAIYIPLGMSGFLAFRTMRFRQVLPVLLGALVSGCVEMTQLYTPTRECSTADLLTNIAGSAVGVIFGIVFEKTIAPTRLLGKKASDPSAIALLFCWVASLLFPAFPVTTLPGWREKIMVSVHGHALSPVILISTAAVWFAAGLLLNATRLRRPGVWLMVSPIFIPAQIAIVTRQPLPVHLVGAITGVALFLLRRKSRGIRTVAAWAFLAVLLMRGLAPFHFSLEAQSFQWVPFGGLLNSEWQYAVQVLIEKLFYYGTAIWLLRTSGIRWTVAIATVAVTLAVIELVQTHIPAHTAEITDPLLALMAGLGLRILRRRSIGYHANS